MSADDRKTLDFLLEQNKELKEALNNQIDKIFTLEEENQQLQEEIEEWKTKEFEYLEKTNRSSNGNLSTIKEAENSMAERETQEVCTQTFEFDDPFEQELVEIQNDERGAANLNRTTFKYSLTNYSRSTFKSVFDDDDINFKKEENIVIDPKNEKERKIKKRN